MNELVQRKAWRCIYQHETRVVESQGDVPTHNEFRATLTLSSPEHQPKSHVGEWRPIAPRSFVGEWATTKKAADVLVATVCYRALEEEGETDTQTDGPKGPPRINASRLRWMLCQPKSGDAVLAIFMEHAHQFRFEHVACTWNMLVACVKEHGYNDGRPLTPAHFGIEALLLFTTMSFRAANRAQAGTAGASSCAATASTSAGGSAGCASSGGAFGPRDHAMGASTGMAHWAHPPLGCVAQGGVSAREVANVAHGVVTALGLPGDMSRIATDLLDECVVAGLRHVEDMKPQELANLCWALAKASHRAPQLFDAVAAKATVCIQKGHTLPVAGRARTDSAFRSDLESVPDAVLTFQLAELTNLLQSFARAAHSAPALFAAFAAPSTAMWRSSGASLAGWSAQDLCNTMWAYAALNEQHFEFMAACERALRSGSFELTVSNFSQVQQWLIWWEAELRRPASLIPFEVRQRSRAALAGGDQQVGHTISVLQREVGRALGRLGVPHVDEFITAEGYSIDLATPPRRLAIEVDGPFHYTQQGTPNGATLLKRRQLNNLGWYLVTVPYDEWYALQRSHDAENAYLGRLIALACQPATVPGVAKPPIVPFQTPAVRRGM